MYTYIHAHAQNKNGKYHPFIGFDHVDRIQGCRCFDLVEQLGIDLIATYPSLAQLQNIFQSFAYELAEPEYQWIANIMADQLN